MPKVMTKRANATHVFGGAGFMSLNMVYIHETRDARAANVAGFFVTFEDFCTGFGGICQEDGMRPAAQGQDREGNCHDLGKQG